MQGSPCIKRCAKGAVYLPLAVGLLIGLTGVLVAYSLTRERGSGVEGCASR